jgi:hypothetical protein
METVRDAVGSAKDLTGVRFGRWLVLRRGERHRSWRCRCECGTERDVWSISLKRGDSRSCGCLPQGNFRHGHAVAKSPTPEYHCWRGMKARCENPRSAFFAHYGGRGIAVCDRWRENFAAFFADMGPRPAGTSIDRIDNDGPYSPGNCRWATPTEQARNRSNNSVVEYRGERITLTEVAQRTGVRVATVSRRVVAGRTADEIASRRNLKITDLTGKRFGSWTVLARAAHRRKWQCVCDCGGSGDVFGTNLTRGFSKRCRGERCT